MKKYNVILFLFLILIGCGDGSTANGKLSVNEANQIVKYHNDAIKYLNQTSSHLEEASSHSYKKMQKIIKKKKNNEIANISFNGVLLTDFIGTLSYFNPNPDNISSLIPSEVGTNLAACVKNYNTVKSTFYEFKDYIKNEDYKDDDWAKANQMLSVLEENIPKYFDNKERAFKVLRNISDEAEIVLLKDHPLKEPIIALKSDLNSIDIILELSCESQKFDKEALDKAYNVLDKNAIEHKTQFKELLQEANKTHSFDDFYDEVNRFMGGIRKAKRDGEITADECEDLYDAYERVIIDYNSFM